MWLWEEKPDPEPETVPEKENQINSALPMLGISAAIGALIAGAYYMLKIRPKKNRTGIDEEREFYDDDGYENEDEVPEEEENETEE